MTVSSQTPINRSTGNGVTTVFPYGFKIISEADIEVTVDGVVKTLNVDYTVSGVGNEAGGNVTMTAAPANLSSVVRRRNMALVRTTDYQDQGEMPAATLDIDFDAAVLMIQQVDEQIGRAVTVPAGVTGFDGELPDPVASMFLRINSAGDGFDLVSEMTPGAFTVTPFIETLLNDTDATAARTTLGAQAAGSYQPRATRIDVASVAGVVNLTTAAPDTDDIRITGALAITGFTVVTDRVLRVVAGGAFTLTNGASLVTQTGANIVCAAGDTFMLRATAANVVEVLNYVFASVVPNNSITSSKIVDQTIQAGDLVGGTGSGGLTQYTAATTPLASSGSSYIGTHSLGVVPKEAVLEITCITAEKGYSAGDVVEIHQAWNGTGFTSFSVWKNTTQCGSWNQTACQILILNKASDGGSSPTAANWSYRFRVRAA